MKLGMQHVKFRDEMSRSVKRKATIREAWSFAQAMCILLEQGCVTHLPVITGYVYITGTVLSDPLASAHLLLCCSGCAAVDPDISCAMQPLRGPTRTRA